MDNCCKIRTVLVQGDMHHDSLASATCWNRLFSFSYLGLLLVDSWCCKNTYVGSSCVPQLTKCVFVQNTKNIVWNAGKHPIFKERGTWSNASQTQRLKLAILYMRAYRTEIVWNNRNLIKLVILHNNQYLLYLHRLSPLPLCRTQIQRH